jgi:RNA polymerase sigma-70 factor (ECF subfamily)
VSVNSALQRARSALDRDRPAERERVALPGSAHERALLGHFAEAFEVGDVARVVELLTSDAWGTMPPEPFEYHGRAAVAAFLTAAFAARGAEVHRLVPTGANTQPAFGHYVAQGSATAHGRGLLVLEPTAERFRTITRFAGDDLLAHFGLARTLTF